MVGTSSREVSKIIKGTNIEVRKVAGDGAENKLEAMLLSLAPDDRTELKWFHRTLRPERNLIHPSDAFVQSIRTLRPAAVFNTFDLAKAKLRRLTKQEKDKLRAMQRRKLEVAPTAAYKAAVNPHKVPRNAGRAADPEMDALLGGKRRKANHKNSKKTVGEAAPKSKKERIGKGL